VFVAAINRRRLVALVAGVVLVAVLVLAWPTLAFHLLPPAWTGEATRLVAVLELAPGSTVADFGAGDGTMAVEVARAVGSRGIVYATELGEEQRSEISDAARDAGLTQVRVIAALDRATGLPDGCCDAVYLRTVLHHIDDQRAYASELRRALKPAGRLAIIDFGPGALFHLAGDHGVTPEQAIAAMTGAGFRLERRVDDWGGRLYLLLFRS
jgi:ubiquinone/menaquinone biosynthesis C-methylase UbiE